MDRPQFRLANGQLLAIYVLGYGIGRLWVESLRIDEAHHLFGLRWNQWVAILLIVAAGGWLLFTMHAPRERIYEPREVPPNTDHDETAALAMATAGLPEEGSDAIADHGESEGEGDFDDGADAPDDVGDEPAVEDDDRAPPDGDADPAPQPTPAAVVDEVDRPPDA